MENFNRIIDGEGFFGSIIGGGFRLSFDKAGMGISNSEKKIKARYPKAYVTKATSPELAEAIKGIMVDKGCIDLGNLIDENLDNESIYIFATPV